MQRIKDLLKKGENLPEAEVSSVEFEHRFYYESYIDPEKAPNAIPKNLTILANQYGKLLELLSPDIFDQDDFPIMREGSGFVFKNQIIFEAKFEEEPKSKSKEESAWRLMASKDFKKIIEAVTVLLQEKYQQQNVPVFSEESEINELAEKINQIEFENQIEFDLSTINLINEKKLIEYLIYHSKKKTISSLYELFISAQKIVNQATKIPSKEYQKVFDFYFTIKNLIDPMNAKERFTEDEFIKRISKLNTSIQILDQKFESNKNDAKERLTTLIDNYKEGTAKNNLAFNKNLKIKLFEKLNKIINPEKQEASIFELRSDLKLSLEEINSLIDIDLGKQIKDWAIDSANSPYAQKILPRELYDRWFRKKKKDESTINIKEEAKVLEEELNLYFPISARALSDRKFDSRPESVKSFLNLAELIQTGTIKNLDLEDYKQLLIEAHKAATLHNNPIKDALAICLSRINIHPVTANLGFGKSVAELDIKRDEKLYGKISTPIETLTRSMSAKLFDYAMRKENDKGKNYKLKVKNALVLARELSLCHTNEKLLEIGARAVNLHRLNKSHDSSSALWSILKELNSKISRRGFDNLTQTENIFAVEMKLEELQEFLDEKRMFTLPSYKKMLDDTRVILDTYYNPLNIHSLDRLTKFVADHPLIHKSRLNSIINDLIRIETNKTQPTQKFNLTDAKIDVLYDWGDKKETKNIPRAEYILEEIKSLHHKLSKKIEFLEGIDANIWDEVKNDDKLFIKHCLNEINELKTELESAYKSNDKKTFIYLVNQIHSSINEMSACLNKKEYLKNEICEKLNSILHSNDHKKFKTFDVDFLRSPSEKLYRDALQQLKKSNNKNMPELLKTLEIINESKKLDENTKFRDMFITIKKAYREHRHQDSVKLHKFFGNKQPYHFGQGLKNILNAIAARKYHPEIIVAAMDNNSLAKNAGEEKLTGATQRRGGVGIPRAKPQVKSIQSPKDKEKEKGKDKDKDKEDSNEEVTLEGSSSHESLGMRKGTTK